VILIQTEPIGGLIMNKMLLVILSLLTVPTLCLAQGAALPMSANPEGIVVLDFKAEFESGIASHTSYFEEKCGYALQTDFNISNLSQGTSEENSHSVSGYCAMPISELVIICEKGDSYKAIVAKKIKKLSCRYLGNTAKRSLVLENGTLTWSFEYESEHDQAHAEFIGNILFGLL
jgi:hypothetical protein